MKHKGVYERSLRILLILKEYRGFRTKGISIKGAAEKLAEKYHIREIDVEYVLYVKKG